MMGGFNGKLCAQWESILNAAGDIIVCSTGHYCGAQWGSIMCSMGKYYGLNWTLLGCSMGS